MSKTRADDILIAYNKNGKEVAQGATGTDEVTVGNLTPATSYAEGDFQVAFSDKDGVSQKVAVPEFETKPQLIESFTLSQGDIAGHIGDNLDIKVATLSPDDATDKIVKVTSKNPAIANIAWNDNVKTFQAHLIKAGTTEFDWVSEDGNASVKQAVKVDPVLMTSFTLNPEAVSGIEGSKVNVSVASINPGNATDNNTKVTSKDPTIATIAWNNDAKAYQANLIKVGTTEFDWVSEDGNASVKQAVKVDPVLMSNFTLNPAAISGVEGSNINIGVATFNPANTTDKVVKATSKDPTIATVDWNNDAKSYQAHLIKAGTTEFDWVSDDGNAHVIQPVTVTAKPAPVQPAPAKPASAAPAGK